MTDEPECGVFKTLIKHLIEVETEYPNFLSGLITWEKIRDALQKGLSTK